MTSKDIFKKFADSQIQAYKGYLITFNEFHNEYYISKEGYHIATAKEISKAKASKLGDEVEIPQELLTN